MKIYALKQNTNVLNISSSGGAYLALVETLFNLYHKNVIVFGVVFNEDMFPEFNYACSLEDSKKFCGSKYVYVNPKSVLEQIANCLMNNKYVLFVGTPCNVHAVVSYLKNNSINLNQLYTIDLICNGTPSTAFWQEYVKWIERKYNKKLVNFKFRKKGGKNNPYLTEAVFSDSFSITDSVWTACYNQAFLKKLSIRKRCFNCPFKSLKREADITIGDFWGISDVLADFNEHDEVSEILINTDKGQLLIDNISPDIKKMECKNDKFLKYQQNLIKNSPIPQGYDEFWKRFNNQGIESVLKFYTDAGKFGVLKYFIKKIARFIGVTKLK